MPRKKRSLMEQAYADLKNRIITLDLKPGERLDDYDLSRELKFSRTPIREAIFLLGAEGWVDIRSKAGFIVRPLDLADVSNLFETHIILAKAVARLAALRITPDELAAIHATSDRISAAIDKRDYLTITAENAELHKLESAASHNSILQGMAESVHEQGQRLAYLCFGGSGVKKNLDDHFRRVIGDHQDMLTALERHDPEMAEKVALHHVRLFRTRVQDFLETEVDFQLTDDDLAGAIAPPPEYKRSGSTSSRVKTKETTTAS